MVFLYRLLNSCLREKIDEVRNQINEGANVNGQERGTLVTALHNAALVGHVEIIELLLNNGARIDAQDSDGNTPLMWAIRNRKQDAVEYLMNRGANIRALNEAGSNCLVIATNTGDNAIINLVQNRMESLRD